MSEYHAPLRDMLFVLRELAPVNQLSALPGFEEVNLELATASLEEAGKFANGVLSPINVSGDREGARWDEGEVRRASGWREAYRHFVEGGWNALSCDPAHGGQGLPRLVSALVEEMWNGANVSFGLCAMQAFVDLMIPVVKGWSTESAVEIASLGVQVHGGMGYVEETGAAQHLRDARITPIYEGTTGIQAADLVGRKVARDGGAVLRSVIAQMRDTQAQLTHRDDPALGALAAALRDGVAALESAAEFVVASHVRDPREALVGSVPFLELLGIVAGGWQMARAALVSQAHLADGSGDTAFHTAKMTTARFYADHTLARAAGLAHTVEHGAHAALAIEDDQL